MGVSVYAQVYSDILKYIRLSDLRKLFVLAPLLFYNRFRVYPLEYIATLC